jgi:IS30 family transposase
VTRLERHPSHQSIAVLCIGSPHDACRHGTRESTNGRLRQYLRRNTDRVPFSHDGLNAIAGSMNCRTRATHA